MRVKGAKHLAHSAHVPEAQLLVVRGTHEQAARLVVGHSFNCAGGECWQNAHLVCVRVPNAHGLVVAANRDSMRV